MQLLVRWSILALGVTLATQLLRGISYDEPSTLILVVVLLSLFNAVLRPLLIFFTLPFILLTLGVGVILINALMFLAVAHLVNGFVVESFWWAMGGAIITGITNVLVNALMRGSPPGGGPGGTGGTGGRFNITVKRGGQPPRDVIDV